MHILIIVRKGSAGLNIRIYNARILTMEQGREIFEGEIQIKDNRIAYVGPTKIQNLTRKEIIRNAANWDREIDAKGNLIMPGFKNAHTHSAMVFLRSFADDLPLDMWLDTKVFPAEKKLTGEDIYTLCKLAIMEYLTSGITANFDMYLDPDQMARASMDTGFRTVICGAMNDFTHSPEEMEQWYLKYRDPDKLVTYQLGFHAEYTTSREKLEQVAKLSQTYKAPVFTHSSETAAEVLGCQTRYGCTPTELFEKLGLLEYGGGCFHCVHMTDTDLSIMKKKNIAVVTCPGSNLKLASGIADVQKMKNQGITVGIGTDGAASNNCLDMFREMFLVSGLGKVKSRDASAMDADEVLRMATVCGAQTMQLSDADVLAENKKADLIMIDLQQPNMQPLHNISKNLVYSGSKSNVKLTMVDGKILYEDGEFSIGVTKEQIYEEAASIVEKVTASAAP